MPDQDSNIPSDLQVVIPHDLQVVDTVNNAVQRGYGQSAQLNQQQQALQQSDAFAAAHPIYNAAMLATQQNNLYAPLAGGERLLNTIDPSNLQSNYWQQKQQESQNWNVKDTGLGKAASILGGVAKFAVGANPVANALQTAGESYGSGDSGRSAMLQGGIAGVFGHLFGKGVSGEAVGGIASKFGPEVAGKVWNQLLARPILAKAAVRLGVGGSGVIAQNMANNFASGKPWDQNLFSGSGLGALTEAALGRVHDIGGKAAASFSPPSGQAPQPLVSTPAETARAAEEGKLPMRWEGANQNPFPAEEPHVTSPAPLPNKYATSLEPNAPPIGQARSSLIKPREENYPLANKQQYYKDLVDFHTRLGSTEGPEAYQPQQATRGHEGEEPISSPIEAVNPNLPPDVRDRLQKLATLSPEEEPITTPPQPPSPEVQRILAENPDLQENLVHQQRQESLQQQNMSLAKGAVEATQEPLPLWMRDTSGGFDTTTAKTLTRKIGTALTDGGKSAVQSLSNFINADKGKIGNWFHETTERAGEKVANFLGLRSLRTGASKQAIDAIRQIDSDTNLYALKLEAAFKPFMANNPHIDRLIDEVEAGQTPSNPGARSFANLIRERNKGMKEWALKLGVKGAEHWDDNRIMRTAAPLDISGRPAYDPAYQGPPPTGTKGSIGGPQDHIYSRKLTGGRDEFKLALQSKGWGEKFADPVTGHLYKQAQLYRYLSTLQKIKDKTLPNRELMVGDKLVDGERLLNDRMFQPFSRKWTAPYAVTAKLNDNTRPIAVRRAEFLQGIKDGTLKELPPHEPNSLLEKYLDDPEWESQTPAQPGQVYEKQHAQGGTGEFGQTRDIAAKTNVHAGGEPATGEFTPTYPEGSIPEGHMIVDDALSQAFDKRRFAAPEYAADIINNHLQQDIVDPKNPIMNGWIKANQGVLQMYMAGTPYHYMNLAVAGTGPNAGEAISRLGHGDVMGAARKAAHAIPIANIRDLWEAGKSLKEAFADPSLHQEMQPVANAIAKTGNVTERPAFLKPVEKPVGWNIVRGASNFLFDKYGDNLKRGSIYYAVQNEIERASKMGISLDSPQFEARAKAAIDSVHNSFDTMRTDKGFQDKLSNLVLRSVFAFPKWTISRWKLAGQSLADIPEVIKTRDLTPAQKSVIGQMTVTALMGAAITAASTGSLPKKPADFFYPMFPNGRRYTIPSPMQPLLSLMFNHGDIMQYLNNRFVPGIRIGQELYQNKNPVGQQTRGSLKDVLQTVGGELHPGLGGSGDALDRIASFFGVRPAPQSLDWTPAEKMAHDMIALHSEVGGKTDEQIAHRDLFNRLLQGLKNNVAGIRDQIAQAHNEKQITDEDRRNLFKYAKEGTGIESLIQAKELAPGDVLKIWEAMNAQEKSATKGIVRRKIAGARSLTPNQRQAYFQEVGQ
jgi:hypothetical protein